jgi:hypothetical protein
MGSVRTSYKGIGQLLCADFIVAEMRRRAEKVKAVAEATAPDATPLGVGYKYEFEIESGVRKRKTKRAFARVRNTSPHALYVEFGGGNTPKHRTLGKALDAAGD